MSRNGRKGRIRNHFGRRHQEHTLAGPVTITRADGTVEQKIALTEVEMQRLLKRRGEIIRARKGHYKLAQAPGEMAVSPPSLQRREDQAA